ncbi:interleukin-1 receptor-associated kinase 1-binding protein 1 [Camelus ferus]|nr:interleukin-1 receptor-associated kinase 1-binding protein 1 [Camelus ferus]
MSLQQAPPSRVFVELVPWTDRGRENNLVSGGETLSALRRPLSSAQAQTSSREVHVSGTAEVSASPDRAQVAVRVSSTKEAAAEAKKSVCRRLDYITQTLQQQGVQVCITFTEFGKMQNICNFLVEKLDSSVVISQPQFYHTSGSVENLRCVKRLEFTVANPSGTLSSELWLQHPNQQRALDSRVSVGEHQSHLTGAHAGFGLRILAIKNGIFP